MIKNLNHKCFDTLSQLRIAVGMYFKKFKWNNPKLKIFKKKKKKARKKSLGTNHKRKKKS